MLLPMLICVHVCTTALVVRACMLRACIIIPCVCSKSSCILLAYTTMHNNAQRCTKMHKDQGMPKHQGNVAAQLLSSSTAIVQQDSYGFRCCCLLVTSFNTCITWDSVSSRLHPCGRQGTRRASMCRLTTVVCMA